MFDSLKGLGARRPHPDAVELKGLVEAAREERRALGELLTRLAATGAQLSLLGTTVDQVDRTVGNVSARLDGVSKRVEGLEARSQALDQVERRVNALVDAATHAQEVTAKILASDGQLQAQRHQLQDLASQAIRTQASLAALKQEQGDLEGIRQELRLTRAEVAQSGDGAQALRDELSRIQDMAQQLGADYALLHGGLQSAREDSATTLETVRHVEALVGPLNHVRDLSQATEDKLLSIATLAEHVSRKAEDLEGKQHAIDHATLEANRVSEIVWGMDVRLSKLHDDLKQAGRAEEALARIQQIAVEATALCESATATRDALSRDAARFETDGRSLVGTMRALLERVSLDKQEFEAFDHRVVAIRSSVGDAEARIQVCLEKEQHLSLMDQRAHSLGETFAALLDQAEALSHRQLGLDGLHERLAEVDELSRRTATQCEGLLQHRPDLDRLRLDVRALQGLHADVLQLRDRLTADRAALEVFSDRVTLFRAETPELEATMDSIIDKLSQVDESSQKASRLADMAGALEDQLTRVSSRIQFVGTLEERLTELQTISAEVDRKLGEQLGRRAELDIVKARLDGVVGQVMNAWHQLEGINVAHQKILPLGDRVVALEQDLARLTVGLRSVRLDEATVKAQAARLGDLAESTSLLAAETAERARQLEVLREEVGRSVAAKDELVAQLAQVKASQREAIDQSAVVEAQLRRAESLHKALDERRAQLRLAEQTVASVEGKIAQLAGRSNDLDGKLKALADREAVVVAVKAEVDAVHQISAQSKADLQYLALHRDSVAMLRHHVHDLLAETAEAEDRLAALRAHRQAVDEVGAKVQQTVRLLDEVRVGLEKVEEHKVAIDQVGEQLARLEFVTQAAERAAQTMQREREMAERMERSFA